MTRSIDSSRKSLVIARLSLRAVSSAASLITLARSAPVKPGVRRATASRSTSGVNGLPLACTRRIALRPSMSGVSTAICRSNRPGRSSAGSRMSGRLVAAIRMTPPLVSKPSISTSSWLSVCSRSSWPPPMPAPRCRPTASISSTKTIAGAFALACSNRSRTRRGADTDEHLDEVRTGDRVERHPGLAGDGAGEQRLTGTGRAEQQHALGDLRAERLVLGRVLQEVLDLVQLLDGLVGTGHVGERRLRRVLGDQLGLGLAEVEHPGAAALHLRHEQQQQDHQDRDRQQVDQQAEQDAVLGDRRCRPCR